MYLLDYISISYVTSSVPLTAVCFIDRYKSHYGNQQLITGEILSLFLPLVYSSSAMQKSLLYVSECNATFTILAAYQYAISLYAFTYYIFQNTHCMEYCSTSISNTTNEPD